MCGEVRAHREQLWLTLVARASTKTHNIARKPEDRSHANKEGNMLTTQSCARQRTLCAMANARVPQRHTECILPTARSKSHSPRWLSSELAARAASLRRACAELAQRMFRQASKGVKQCCTYASELRLQDASVRVAAACCHEPSWKARARYVARVSSHRVRGRPGPRHGIR